jgi:Na+/melibiose symporter-like transporter
MTEETYKQFSWGRIILIGLGFFTTGLTWPMFNDYIPLILQDYAIPAGLPGFAFIATLAGLIMGIDNLLALFMNPLMGSLSDKTKTKLGRRMPYLVIGIPLSAAFFVGLPLTMLLPGALALIGIIVLILGFDISMAIYRAPTVAMMPDFTPPEKRSPANGVINLMGGIGGIIAVTAGALLVESYGPTIAFGAAALIMCIALIIMMLSIREPDIPPEVQQAKGFTLWQTLRLVFKERSFIAILLAIFSWFMGYNALETWLTSYGVYSLGWTAPQSSLVKVLFILTFIVFAVPGGVIGRKAGRKTTILVGLIGMMATIAIVPLLGSQYVPVMAVLGLTGIFWAMVNVNSIVIVWELSQKKLGAGTGIYYVFSQSSAALGPVLFGVLADLLVISLILTINTKFILLWPYALVFWVLAFIFMLFVRRGEAGEEEQPIKET